MSPKRTMSLQSGQTYKLTNVKAGTVMDLSGFDNTSIIGYPYHNGTNQHWLLDWVTSGWTFKSVSSGQFVGLNGTIADGTPLVASTDPVPWYIWPDDVDPSVYRVFTPNADFNFDLSGHGDPNPGTPIQIWSEWSGIHQTWRFETP